MRIFLCLLLVACFTFSGYLLSQKYKKRKDFYFDFKIFNNKLTTEINFSKNSIVKIVSELNDDSLFNIEIKKYIKNSVAYVFIDKYLTKDEIEYFYEYLKNLGGSDSSTQLKFLNSTNEILLEKCDLTDKNYKQYKPLYIKLGFLVGLIIGIILL